MGLGSCQNKRFLSCGLDEPNAQELQQIDAHYKQIPTWKHERTKIFLKPDRDQTEVFSTSNYNVTECRGSLSNKNSIDLIQIISVFVTMYLLASPAVVTFPKTSYIFQISN